MFSRMLCISAVVAGLGLAGTRTAAAQGQMMDMNNLPYDSVKAMLSDPARAPQAMAMAKNAGVVLMAGMPVHGTAVTMKGELTGANCYLSGGLHGHSHAMCAKACVAAGSPVIFIGDNGTVYTVLTAKNGVPLPNGTLDFLGRPGVTVKGSLVTTHGVKSLALEEVRS
jgi:hypothetical protein